MEVAQDYEDSASSLRDPPKKEKIKKQREKDRKKKKEETESDSSEVDNNQEKESEEEGEPDSESDPPKKSSSSKTTKSGKEKATIKIIVEPEDGMKQILDELCAIKVNLAENRAPRKLPSSIRSNVWCS